MQAACVFEAMMLACADDVMRRVLSNPGSSDDKLIQLQWHMPLRAASLFVACVLACMLRQAVRGLTVVPARQNMSFEPFLIGSLSPVREASSTTMLFESMTIPSAVILSPVCRMITSPTTISGFGIKTWTPPRIIFTSSRSFFSFNLRNCLSFW